MKIDWIPFEAGYPLPRERKCVLVQLSTVTGYSVGAVVVGYLRFAAGDRDCPYFVTPGVKRTNDYDEIIPREEMLVTHWADVFGHDFECPGWPGTYEGASTRDSLQGRKPRKKSLTLDTAPRI